MRAGFILQPLEAKLSGATVVPVWRALDAARRPRSTKARAAPVRDHRTLKPGCWDT